MLDPTGAVGTPTLDKIALHFLLHLLIDGCVDAGRTVQPRLIATA